jgi:hypothetical protein
MMSNEPLNPEEAAVVDYIDAAIGPNGVTRAFLISYRDVAKEIEARGSITLERFKEIERRAFMEQPAVRASPAILPSVRPN